MNKNYYIYLDLFRFLFALVVFIGHASGQLLTGGFLWPVGGYIDAAVICFFVLSGYVIAFVANNKENNFSSYITSRLARLWSVVAPALILTFALDYFGFIINSKLYLEGPWSPINTDFLNYFFSFFFVQNFWEMNLNPGINSPFWSLSYEFAYYLIFGILFYLRSKWKYLIVFILLAMAGPKIIIYFPFWLTGVLVYYIHNSGKSRSTNKILHSSVFLFSIFIFINYVPDFYSSRLADLIFGTQPPWINKYLADSFVSVLTGLNLLSFYYIAPAIKIHSSIVKIISFLAASSFSLYLFHRPIVQFMAAVFPPVDSYLLNISAVYVGTIAFVLSFGFYIEKTKTYWKNFISKLIH